MFAHVIYEVAAVSSQSKQPVAAERRGIGVDGLNDRHDEGRSDKTNPFVVEEGERLGAETEDEARSETHSKEEGRKG